MKPPKIATAMMPSRLYFAFASALCGRATGGLKLASTFPLWWIDWLRGALAVVVVDAAVVAGLVAPDVGLVVCGTPGVVE